MVARRIALASLLLLVVLATTELCLAVMLSENRHKQATASLIVLSRHQGPMLQARATANQASWSYETEWVLRNAREYPDLQSLEVKDSTTSLISLDMGNPPPEWMLARISHTPDPMQPVVWTMAYRIFAASDLVLMARIGLMGFLTWLCACLLITLISRPSRPRPVQMAEGATEPADSSPAAHEAPAVYEDSEIHDASPAAAPGEETVQAPAAKPEAPTSLPVVIEHSREQDFLYRLERELSRAAENALDLSVALIRADALREQADKAAKVLLAEFTHDDLLFRVDNRTWAIILPHNDLDQAMARIELFLRKVMAKAEEAALFGQASAGLSSRSGRMVEARRVYREAGIAVRKADPASGRIAGFRADPSRYRNFLTHHKI